MNLFKCRTIDQFRIGSWLAEQGITDEDIASAELNGPDTVTIYNAAGQYLILHWRGDHVEIDTEEVWP